MSETNEKSETTEQTEKREPTTIYVDIDGTLTKDPEEKWGEVHQNRIDKVKEFIDNNHIVIVWSGNGIIYANEFCKKYDIKPLAALSKPDYYVDDKINIRAEGKLIHLPPERLDHVTEKAEEN